MGKGMKFKKSGVKKHSKTSDRSDWDKLETDAAENEYLTQVLDLKATCSNWSNLFSRSIQEDRRILQWQHASMMGEPLLNKYAWAVPSNKAIRILAKFSPLVEMGAGKGYWAHLVQRQGGYVLPFDIVVPKKKEAWTEVFEGTPQSILSPAVAKNKNAPLKALNLFLCYPDQGTDVGLPSLEAFQALTDEHNNLGQGAVGTGGGYIIHVGELLTTGCISGAPQAPWGRTSSPDFQERLFKDYHCVLTLPLESFPFSRDYLTVWKRTIMFDAKEMEFGDTSSDDSGDGGGAGDIEEEEAQPRKKRKTSPREEKEEDDNDDGEEVHSDDDKDDDDDDKDDDDEEEEEGEENEDEWADIPSEERLPSQMQATAAPCMSHLLE